jgi:hypothetical protein
MRAAEEAQQQLDEIKVPHHTAMHCTLHCTLHCTSLHYSTPYTAHCNAGFFAEGNE